MDRLRQFLKDKSPELYASLERSWYIAEEEWLPLINIKSDSYNSYPHLRNIENYLNEILFTKDGTLKIELTPSEIYLLLAAILFHDIGRIYERDTHETESRKLIANNSSYAKLGIPSHEVAKALGRICAFHEEDGRVDLGMHPLPDIVVAPLGPIRQSVVGALLVFADHLDSAHTRVLPKYLQMKQEIEILGAFRRVILGVNYDQHAQMVRTVLGEQVNEKATGTVEYGLPKKINRKNKLSEVIRKCIKVKKFKTGTQSLYKLLDIIKLNKNKINIVSRADKINAIKINTILRKLSGIIARQIKFKRKLLQSKGTPHFPLFDPLDVLVSQGLVQVSLKKGKWPTSTVLAVILADAQTNGEVMAESIIRDTLNAIGLPIRAWLIEWKGHLINCLGYETYEPIFNKAYLARTAKCMRKMSAEVFGCTIFTYANLAAELREPDMQKVRLAVKRLAIVCFDQKNTVNKNSDAIWAGETQWKLNVQKYTIKKPCCFVTEEEIKAAIGSLGDPQNG